MKLMRSAGAMLLAGMIVFSCGEKKSADQLWSEARALQSEEKHDEAIKVYKRLLRDYAEGEYGPRARFTLADTYVNIKKEYESAVTEYRKTINDYPDTDYAPKSLFMIGYIYANYSKDIDKAEAAYKEFLEKYPESDLVAAVDFELTNLGKDLDDIDALKDITGTKGN